MAYRGFAACLMAAVVLAGTAVPAFAQRSDLRDMMNRLERMQRELTTLQQSVYQGKPPPPGAATAPGGLDRRASARVEVRLSQLENELRRVTGKAEELEHAVGRFNSRLDKLISDIDVRLNTLEQRQGIATAGDAGMTPPPAGSPDAPPSNLGTISPDAHATRRASPAKPILPKGTPKEQYDHATSLLLADQNIEEAERALSAFIEANPRHKLTSNAHYWLGETYYVRKQFQQAAYTFADGFQKFPRSRKAADNLLKLGMSLGQLGKKKQACTAYSRLLSNFPNAGKNLTKRVGREQRRLKCR